MPEPVYKNDSDFESLCEKIRVGLWYFKLSFNVWIWWKLTFYVKKDILWTI